MLIILAFVYSCEKPTESSEARVTITEDLVTSSTVEFTLTPVNSTKTYFTITKGEVSHTAEEVKAGEFIEDQTARSMEKVYLDSDSKYTISALATNDNGESEVTSIVIRTKVADDNDGKLGVTLTPRSVTSSTIEFMVTPHYADRTYFLVTKGSDPKSADEVKKGIYLEGLALSIIPKDGLQADTEYTVSALAVNADNEESEVVSIVMKTEISEVPDTELTGELKYARFLYMGNRFTSADTGNYRGTLRSTENVQVDSGSGFVYADIKIGGIVIEFSVFNYLLENPVSPIIIPEGTYTVGTNNDLFTYLDTASFLTTVTDGSPKAYDVNSGTLVVSKKYDSDEYVFTFDIMVKHLADFVTVEENAKITFTGKVDCVDYSQPV